jgi:hypothetical protein
MKTQFNVPGFAFLTMMAVAVAGTKVSAASNIKIASLNPGNALVYERVLNPYITITTDRNTVGSTYSVRDQNGKIIRTGIVKSAKTLSIAINRLTTGVYSVHIGGNLLQQFIVK